MNCAKLTHHDKYCSSFEPVRVPLHRECRVFLGRSVKGEVSPAHRRADGLSARLSTGLSTFGAGATALVILLGMLAFADSAAAQGPQRLVRAASDRFAGGGDMLARPVAEYGCFWSAVETICRMPRLAARTMDAPPALAPAAAGFAHYSPSAAWSFARDRLFEETCEGASARAPPVNVIL